jgi:hypothetical protein
LDGQSRNGTPGGVARDHHHGNRGDELLGDKLSVARNQRQGAALLSESDGAKEQEGGQESMHGETSGRTDGGNSFRCRPLVYRLGGCDFERSHLGPDRVVVGEGDRLHGGAQRAGILYVDPVELHSEQVVRGAGRQERS